MKTTININAHKSSKWLWLGCFIGLLLFNMNVFAQSAGSTYLNKQFEADVPSQDQLKIFEQRAMQKLEDFEGYVRLIVSEQTDPKMREQVKTMFTTLFEKGQESIPLTVESTFGTSVALFLALPDEEIIKVPEIEIDNIKLKSALRKDAVNPDQYTGILKFMYREKSDSDFKMGLECYIVLKKVPVEFGRNTQDIWKVYLGDMYK